MRNSMLNKALFPVHIYEKLISGKPSMIQLSDMTNTYVSCIMMNFISFVGLGRAKARPEIWPAGHAFWVARPNPGHIFEGPK